jgi:hypothetical protein
MPDPLQLEASCHCGAIQFKFSHIKPELTGRVVSKTPYPYLWCYCSICRKTNGSGGYGINIAAEVFSSPVYSDFREIPSNLSKEKISSKFIKRI